MGPSRRWEGFSRASVEVHRLMATLFDHGRHERLKKGYETRERQEKIRERGVDLVEVMDGETVDESRDAEESYLMPWDKDEV